MDTQKNADTESTLVADGALDGALVEELEGFVLKANSNSDLSRVPAFSAFLVKLSQYPVLSAESQAELAQQIRDGRRAEADMEHITDPARKRRAALVARRGREALEFLVGSNLRLVLVIARELGRRRLQDRAFDRMGDLVQAGNLGLMEAINRFEPSRGTPFPTFAAIYIRQHVGEALNRDVAIPVPTAWVRLARVVSGVRQDLHRSLNREPSIAELKEASYQACVADAMSKIPEGFEGSSEEGIRQVLSKSGFLRGFREFEQVLAYSQNSTVSLEAPLGSDEDAATLEDYLSVEDEPAQGMFTGAELDELRESLFLALGSLSDREREIILLRYGFVDDERWTYAQLGERFGVTAERIRQIEHKVLNRLSSPHAQYMYLASHLDSRIDETLGESPGPGNAATVQRRRAQKPARRKK